MYLRIIYSFPEGENLSWLYWNPTGFQKLNYTRKFCISKTSSGQNTTCTALEVHNSTWETTLHHIIALGPYIWGSSAISKTAPFLKSLVLQILFLWKQLYNFNLPIAILKALSTALYLFFNWLEVIFCLYTRGLISRVYLSPIIIWPLFWHDEPGATRGWWSLSKRSKVPRDLQFSAFLTVKFHVWILSLPRVFFPRRVKSWMKNMIASFWELDLRWALQHLSKKSVAVASGGFRKAWIVDRVSHPIWNFLRSRKTSWFHVNLKLLDRRISFENLHLGSKDKLVYKPILKYFKSWNSGVLRGISCISFYI